MSSLAHDFAAVLRLERAARKQPSQHTTLEMHKHRRDLYFRLACECQAEGDLAGAAEATRAAGLEVTAAQRTAGIGMCPACGEVRPDVQDGASETASCRACAYTWTPLPVSAIKTSRHDDSGLLTDR